MEEHDSQDMESNIDLREDKKSLLSRSTDSTEVPDFMYEVRDQRRRKRQRYWHIAHLSALYLFSLGATIALIVMGYGEGFIRIQVSPYSVTPAEVAVSYETYTFDSTEYAGPPTPEMNQRWRDLYHHGVATRVSREEMRKITKNDTYELPNGEHLINLEMFHQLHCLDIIRHALYSRDYPGFFPYDTDGNPIEMIFGHLQHCVDRLLHGITCASNTAPSVWERRAGMPHEGAPFEEWINLNHRTPTTCRNFKAVQQWAFQRELRGWESREEGAGIKMIH
ncbi:hypothetical protein F4777DRAFT_574589 [Nemania sp. FL0916]|nr:hypothetical protein F4777DRAFT_574589 [Nemania sp. FL0916]